MISPEQIAPYARVPFTLEVELGRTTMTLREIAALKPGSIVRLSRPVGARLDLYAAGLPFATGEIVAIEDTVAARIVSLIEKKES
jgi:flagellar motor switch protein FliN